MQLPQPVAWVPLRNSDRPIPPGAKWLGPVDPSEPIMIAIHIRPGVRPVNRRQELGEGNGADPADLDKVQEFASLAGLDVIEVSAPRRSAVVWGTAAAIAGAFRVELTHYDYAGTLCRAQIGPVYLPPTIAHIVEEVSGLESGFPDLVAGAATPLRGLPRPSTRQIAIPLLVVLVGSAAVLVSRGSVFERSTSRHSGGVGQTVGPMPPVVPLSPAAARQLHDAGPSHALVTPRTPKDPAQLELAAWRSLNAGRLREAQDNFLRVLAQDPTRSNAMRGLVAVRRRMDDDNPRLIRQQMTAYRAALTRGVAADGYTPSALKVLISAGLTAAQELETQREPAAGATPVKTLQTPATPVDRLVVTAAPETPLPQSAGVTSPAAPPVPAPVSTPSQPIPAPGPAPAATPAATAPAQPSSRLYVVRIGPLIDRDRALAIAKQLSASGFPQAQVSAQTGYRVLSEPLPRQVADKLAATLAAQGVRSTKVALTGDTVQLVLGAFVSQKEAETLSGRVAAAGYAAWIRETPLYTVQLGPHPRATAATISDIVRASAPDAAVTVDDASSPPSPVPPAAAPQTVAPPPQPLAPPPAGNGQ